MRRSPTGTDPSRAASARLWAWVALAFVILMITMGARQTVGLFVQPISADKGLSIAEVSLALAVGQLVWGIFQPVFGLWADKGGAFAAMCTGVLCTAAGQLLTIWADSIFSLTLAQGILAPLGAAAGSFPLLIGLVSAKIPQETRSVASGIINAGGSLGQFIFAPLAQFAIHLRGYYAGLVFLAGAVLLTLIPARPLCRTRERAREPLPPAGGTPELPALARQGLKEQLGLALRTPSYILLHCGFFTCGFHVAFLTTHLPGEIALCGHSGAVSAMSISLIGLSNVVGSLGVGFLGRRFRLKILLAWIYAGRAAMIALYLASPKTEMSFYLFALGTGLSWLATVPPTSGLVGKLFGVRYLSTLFGLTLLTHQVGAFIGVWLGGLAMSQANSLLWVWYVDIALALFAALVNLPVKEDRPARPR
ncbi:MAG: MFS transporter [Deltaproteobacteria bacterium]|jgi:MFS family permease|nr:MFS transporter [Deltaproteobacteria bacterium]